jgi:hypothetical protein
VRRRRRDLLDAITALDGDSPIGTLVDHLCGKPRISGTRRRMEDARERLARAEQAVEKPRRKLA